MAIRNKIRAYIEDNLEIYDEEACFTDEDNIFKMGFVSSFFAMKLLHFIEKEFEISIESGDIDISNFSTVNNMVALLRKKGVEIDD